MQVELERATKPLRKLRKLLQDFPPHPSPDEVHDLRTRSRKLEAIVHTFSSEHDSSARRLLTRIKPLRKAAGAIRDMDVFIARLNQIRMEPEGDGLVRLTEHIATLREKHVTRLHRVIAGGRRQMRRSLKRYLQEIESGSGDVSPAAAQIRAAELDHWPKLHADNLHDFRIHAKELRYMLQLVQGLDRQKTEALGEVKDAAGEWHDWMELHALAGEVLDREEDREILTQIAKMAADKLRAALTAANRLRKHSIDVPRAA